MDISRRMLAEYLVDPIQPRLPVMQEVLFYLKLQLLATLTLALLLWVLRDRQRLFRWWAWAWTCFATFLLLGALSLHFGDNWNSLKNGLTLTATELGFLSLPLLILGAWSLRESKIQQRHVHAGIAAALVAGALVFLLSAIGPSRDTAFFVRSAPRTSAAALVMVFCAWKFARYWRRRRSSAAAFAAVCCLLSAVNQGLYSISLTQRLLFGTTPYRQILLDFRFLEFHEFVLLDVVYTTGLCVAMLLLHFEDHRRLEQALLLSNHHAKAVVANNAALQAHIAERQRIEEALRESDTKFRSLAESVACGIWIHDGTHFLYLNSRVAEQTGYSRRELLGMDVCELVHPEYRDLVRRRVQQRFAGEDAPSRYEIKMLTRSGEEQWIDLTAEAIEFQGQRTILGTAFEVTRQKQLEERLHQLGQRLIHAQEEERARVALELHDNINQQLALLGIGIQQLRRPEVKLTKAARLEIDRLWSLAHRVSQEVHTISHELYSWDLRHRGLAAAVQKLADEFAHNCKINVECRCLGIPIDLDNNTCLALFRIIQEALSNTAKHSHAQKVRIDLVAATDALCLEFSDDGIGFDPGGAVHSGLGLSSMTERARLLGGEFSLQSSPAAGTRIDVLVPLTSPRKPVARQGIAIETKEQAL